MTAEPRSDLRKGWCPGALRPMMARDGLLVRLRICGGIVSAQVARALADLADAHGNGLFDLTGRGNLQMRGVGEATLPALLDGLGGLALLDADAASEAVRNVVASPLAGMGTGLDIRPVVARLEAALSADDGLRRLPGKFGFLVDDGGSPNLADVAADVRFEWSGDTFVVRLGGTRDAASFAGVCSAETLVSRALKIARDVATLQAQDAPPRRMGRLLREIGPAASARIFGVEPEPPATRPAPSKGDLAGARMFDGRSVLGLAAPFGRLDAAMLRAAADIADRRLGELRLTPWRTILVPDQERRPFDCDAERVLGFIVDPADPRLRVAACTGRDGCTRGSTATHADATALADLAAALGPGTTLHVSGCEKGCAKPSRSAVTLVGRDGRYDLVRNGTAGDPPSLRGLDVAAVRTALLRSPHPVSA